MDAKQKAWHITASRISHLRTFDVFLYFRQKHAEKENGQVYGWAHSYQWLSEEQLAARSVAASHGPYAPYAPSRRCQEASERFRVLSSISGKKVTMALQLKPSESEVRGWFGFYRQDRLYPSCFSSHFIFYWLQGLGQSYNDAAIVLKSSQIEFAAFALAISTAEGRPHCISQRASRGYDGRSF